MRIVPWRHGISHGIVVTQVPWCHGKCHGIVVTVATQVPWRHGAMANASDDSGVDSDNSGVDPDDSGVDSVPWHKILIFG